MRKGVLTHRLTRLLPHENASLTQETSYPPSFYSTRERPKNTRESEGPSSSAGSRGRPLVTAKRAASPSEEGWREVRREEGNASQCMVPFLSLRKRYWVRRSAIGERVLYPQTIQSFPLCSVV